MKIQIAVDSSSDLVNDSIKIPGVEFAVVPLTINVDGTTYVDDETMNTEKMLQHLSQTKGKTNSSCPSVQDWADVFSRADVTFAVCLSSKLSGTYNSAVQAADLVMTEQPGKKVIVFDSQLTAGTLSLTVDNLTKLIAQALPIDTIMQKTTEFLNKQRLLFSLSNFDTLVKTGRMNKLVGVAVSALGIRAIARGLNGEIKVIDKVRGEVGAIERMVKQMEKIKPEFPDLPDAKVIISHCLNEKGAEQMKTLIMQTYKNVTSVKISDTRGLCSFYANKGGLILSF